MRQPDATTIRGLLLDPTGERQTWFVHLLNGVADGFPHATAQADVHADLAACEAHLIAAEAEGHPVSVLLVSRRQLQAGGNSSCATLDHLVNRHPFLQIIVSDPEPVGVGDDLSVQMTERVLFVREPLCPRELTQLLRVLLQNETTGPAAAHQASPTQDMPVPDNAKLLLKALLESLPNSVYFKDLDSRFVAVSNTQAQWFGAEPWELVGKSEADIQDQHTAERARAEEQEIIRTGRAVTGASEHITLANGNKKWVITNKAPFRDQQGKVMGTFGVGTDISGLKQAEEELKQMHTQLMEASRQAGMAEVATGVLHNVGNVLNSVMTSIASLKDVIDASRVRDLIEAVNLLEANGKDLSAFLAGERGEQFLAFMTALSKRLQQDGETQQAELETINKHVQHICQIVSMQQGYAKVLGVQERVRVSELIDQAVMINAAGLERHGVHLKKDIQTDPEVLIDRHKVLQILVNLVSNAKYACDERPEGGRLITIRATCEGESVSIEVVDTGIGIPDEHMKRIFTHGFTTKKDGHGFGLHNSVLAAQELGGDLTAASEGLGHGATFCLALPIETLKEAA